MTAPGTSLGRTVAVPEPISRWWRAVRHRGLALGMAVVLVGLIGLPLGALVEGSFRTRSPVYPTADWTTANWTELVETNAFAKALWNTATLSVPVAMASTLLGGLLAWATTRTDAPFGKLVDTLILVPLVMSPSILAMGWIGAFSPNSGLLNTQVLNRVGLNFNVHSMPALMLAMVMFLTPLAYVFIAAALRNVSADVEEASRVHGAGRRTTMFRVTLPLVSPAVASSTLLIVITAAEMFSMPALLANPIGYENLATWIYRKMRASPADWTGASAAGAVLLVLVTVGILLNQRITKHSARYVTVTGKGARAGRYPLGRWRWPVGLAALAYTAIAVLVPLGTLAVGSVLEGSRADLAMDQLTLENYRFLANPLVRDALKNSLLLGVVGPLMIVSLALVVAQCARVAGRRLGGMIDVMATLPVAIPGLVLAIAFMWLYFPVTALPIYGTITILLLAYLAKFLPESYRILSGALLQLSPELGEASSVAGARRSQTFWRVTFPLVRPAVSYATILVFLFVMREVTVAVVLGNTGVLALSPLTWDILLSGNIRNAYALGMLQVGLVLVVLVGARLLLSVRVFSGDTFVKSEDR